MSTLTEKGGWTRAPKEEAKSARRGPGLGRHDDEIYAKVIRLDDEERDRLCEPG